MRDERDKDFEQLKRGQESLAEGLKALGKGLDKAIELIGVNKTAIEANRTAIEANRTAIEANRTAIEANKTAIEGNSNSFAVVFEVLNEDRKARERERQEDREYLHAIFELQKEEFQDFVRGLADGIRGNREQDSNSRQLCPQLHASDVQ